MWPAAPKLFRLRPLGRTSNSQRIQYYHLITQGLAISPDFAEIFPAYVEANGGNAVVPTKLITTTSAVPELGSGTPTDTCVFGP